MSVSCLLSHTYHDLRCPVCGEGFLILAADTTNHVSRAALQRRVSEALRSHHTTPGAMQVHPTQAFPILTDHAVDEEWLSALSPFSDSGMPLPA